MIALLIPALPMSPLADSCCARSPTDAQATVSVYVGAAPPAPTPNPKFSCISNKCVEDVQGPFATSAECAANCHAPKPPPTPPPSTPHYANPYTGACTGGDKRVQLPGIPGEFCAPHCTGTGSACPAVPYSTGVKGDCIVDEDGGGTPSGCAMTCAGTSAAGCPAGAKCVDTSASGAGAHICTYEGKGPKPPPPPNPPPPPAPPKGLVGDWIYDPPNGGHDVYQISSTGSGEFQVKVVSGGSGWKTAHGVLDGTHVSITFDNGNQDSGETTKGGTTIDWTDGTTWTRKTSPSPPPSPSPGHSIGGSWHYNDDKGNDHMYLVDALSDGSFTAKGDGQPWHTASGHVSMPNIDIKYDISGEMTGTVSGDYSKITWQDGTDWTRSGRRLSEQDSGLLLARMLQHPLPARIDANPAHVTLTCPGSASKSHCEDKGKLSASVAVGNTTGVATLSIVVEAADNSSRSVYSLTVNVTAPPPAPSGGCYGALGSVCDAARKQGMFACGSCAGAHTQPLHAAGCNQSQIQTWCSNATCAPALEAVCAAAKKAGAFQCASCIGAHRVAINTSCTAAEEQAWCAGGGPSPAPPPPAPGQCTACGSAAVCCVPGQSPPQLCPGGSQCCACGKPSCAC